MENKVSIIIVSVKEPKECVKKCQEYFPKAQIIMVLGTEAPGIKRDFAAQRAQGSILAFIDSDAYPHPEWLKNALIALKSLKVVAVGGIGLTPPEDSVNQKISGLIYESTPIGYRYRPDRKRFVKEMPSCNLIIKKKYFLKAGGFGVSFFPGEDSVLCAKLLKYGKILYDPTVIVYHHRRPFPFGHWKQLSNYGKMRGTLFWGQISTYIVYGINFIKGFLRKRL
jgi:hypothetical protein